MWVGISGGRNVPVRGQLKAMSAPESPTAHPSRRLVVGLAVAAVAGAGDTSYAAFSGPPGPWQPAQGVRRLLASIELEMDRNAPTQLNQAVLAVRAWRGSQLVLDAQGAMRDLKGWGSEHARRLMHASDPHGGVDALYAGSYLSGYAHVKARSLATG